MVRLLSGGGASNSSNSSASGGTTHVNTLHIGKRTLHDVGPAALCFETHFAEDGSGLADGMCFTLQGS